MQNEKFVVRKVKCNGCVNNIKKNLTAITGVTNVQVMLPSKETPNGNSTVEVQGTELSREVIIMRLNELGYPLV